MVEIKNEPMDYPGRETQLFDSLLQGLVWPNRELAEDSLQVLVMLFFVLVANSYCCQIYCSQGVNALVKLPAHLFKPQMILCQKEMR